MTPDARLDTLLARRAEFLGWIATRLGGNHADAEDVLQHGLTKALASAHTLRDDERLVPWFYQLLRHALIDHVRARHAASRREERWASESHSLARDNAEAERIICRCIEPLMATLPAAQAELIRRAELNNEPLKHIAASLGLTPNATSVTLHRARTTLRAKLISFCGDCASGACLDCDCEASTTQGHIGR